MPPPVTKKASRRRWGEGSPPARERRATDGSERTMSETRDQLLHPLVPRLERVLAQHRALGLVVELQVDPIDGEVALALLGPADELAPQAGPRGLGRLVHRLLDVAVGAHALDQVAVLELVVQAPLAVDVVVLPVHERPLRVP